ncbi:MAG TPA: hypothetical protein VKA68_14350 [bacterium]|nr:hypothetical protein [bacterium]
MKKLFLNKRIFIIGVLTILVTVTGCEDMENPAGPEEDQASHTMRLQVQPPPTLRTEETWNLWTSPLDVTMDVELAGAEQSEADAMGRPKLRLHKVAHEDSAGADSSWIGSFHGAGMDMSVMFGGGMNMWERRHNGQMEEHHARTGAHHYGVQILDAATGEPVHGGMVIPQSAVTLFAVSSGDTTEIHLKPAQGSHGYRYESNAVLEPGTYTLLVEISPPNFYRTEQTRNKWTSVITTRFTGFEFDGTVSEGVIGDSVFTTSGGDSVYVSLKAGEPRTYGAVNTGLLTPDPEENINFALRLEDPTREAFGQPVCEAIVTITVTDNETGNSEEQTLHPTYGPFGYYYGGNMMMELYQGEHTHHGGMFGGQNQGGFGHHHGPGSMMGRR